MTTHNRLFADVSSNNPAFDAREYKAAGHVLVAIKATEGVNFVSPNHRGWCLRAGLEHIGIVHYHFARPDLSDGPEAEATHFLRSVRGLAGGRDYLCLDLERSVPAGFVHDPAWSRAFDQHIQRFSHYHTVLYANRSTLEGSDEWLTGDKRRVWDADWSTDPNFAPPGYGLFARQFSDGVQGPGPHEFAGIGRCDGNAMSVHTFGAVTKHLP
jgi:lysozyme